MLQISKSGPVLAVIISTLAYSWTLLQICDMLREKVAVVDWYWVVMTLSLMGFSVLVDFIRRKRVHVDTNIRKIFTFIGFVGLSVILSVQIVVTDEQSSISLLFTTAIFSSMALCGFYLNVVDFAPKFSGLIIGAVNTVGICSGIEDLQMCHLVRNLSNRDTKLLGKSFA